MKQQIALLCTPRHNIVAQIWPNDHNNIKHPQMMHEKFDHLANNTQHVTTGWPNACNMLRPTMLEYIALNVAMIWVGL